jgi:hypothetical protein
VHVLVIIVNIDNMHGEKLKKKSQLCFVPTEAVSIETSFPTYIFYKHLKQTELFQTLTSAESTGGKSKHVYWLKCGHVTFSN